MISCKDLLTMRNDNENIKHPNLPGGVRELLVIALPMMVSQVCETLMMFSDRFLLARLGPEHMSAAMGGGLTCFLFMTFFIGLTNFAGALVAQHLGAGQRHRCAVAVTQGMIISLFAAPLIILCIPLGHWLFELNGIDKGQQVLQEQYFNILVYGSIFGLLRNNLASFFSGIGRTKVVMVATASALIVNVIANYALIFGNFGAPALGIRGSAIGTVIGGFSGLVVLLFIYLSPRFRHEYQVLSSFRFDRELMGKLFRFGYPSGLEFFLNIFAFNILVLNFHSYGREAAAAMTIMLNWEMVSFIPLIGVGIAVSSLVGRYMGAQKPDFAHNATMSGVKVAGFYTSITFILFCIFPAVMVTAFRPEGGVEEFAKISELATFMLRMVVIYLFADAMMIVFSGALRGAGDTFWMMVISVSGHWTFAISAILMVRVLYFPPRLTWTIIVFLVLLLGLSMFLRYRTGKWRTLKVVEEAPLPITEDVEFLY